MDPQQEREELARLMSEQQRLQDELANLSGRLLELAARDSGKELEPANEQVPEESQPEPQETDEAPQDEELGRPPKEEEEEIYEVPKPIIGRAFGSGHEPELDPRYAAQLESAGKSEEELRRTPPPVPQAVVMAAQARAEAEAQAHAQAHAQAAAAMPPTPSVELGPDSEGIRKLEGPAPQAPADDESTAKPKRGVQASAEGDWELNLGRIWFVRIGVGLLLTGLVFLSLYAYNNWFFYAPPGVKVSCFFLISLSMVIGGFLIERRREHMRHYGQVLSAGGLAAGYYTIYASHFVAALKVIDIPAVAAILLTLWAGGMLVYAAWRRGRILALMSIGMAYYSTVVNPSGWISLFSSLLLSASAMVLLIRYRWVSVGAAGLAAAYISHAFWLGIMGQAVEEHVRMTYLGCNWLLFTVALHVPQAKDLGRDWRRAMLGVNNMACWLLLVFHLPSAFSPEGFDPFNPNLTPDENIGWISIYAGLAWMVIAIFTHCSNSWRREYRMIWATQGLLIATLGLMIEATGYHRFLVLACEACVLLAAARHFAPKWTRLAAVLCYVLSVVFAVLEYAKNGGGSAPWEAYLFTSLFGFGFVALMRRDVDRPGDNEVHIFYGSQYRLAPMVFAWVPWAILIFGCILRWEPRWTVLGLCGAPLLFTVCHALIGRRETLDAALFSPLALLVTCLWFMDPRLDIPYWGYGTSTLMVAIYWLMSEAARSHFKSLEQLSALARSRWMEWIAALVLAVILYRWLDAVKDSAQAWLVVAPAIAIGGTVVHLLTRRHSLAWVLAWFHCGSIFTLWFNSAGVKEVACVGPLLGLVIHLVVAEFYYKEKVLQGIRALAGAATTLAFAGLALARGWEEPELWLALWSSTWLAFSFWRTDAYAALTGGMLPLLVASVVTLLFRPLDNWNSYYFLPVLPLASLLVRALRFDKDINWKAFDRLAGVCGILLLSVRLSLHVTHAFEGAGLAICWGLYAMLLFTAGLILMNRLFRRFGLLYLLIALIHILVVDVMKLDTLGRILSFLTLGAVLILLGYLYNQYQDKIRKYL